MVYFFRDVPVHTIYPASRFGHKPPGSRREEGGVSCRVGSCGGSGGVDVLCYGKRQVASSSEGCVHAGRK
jgi:hypothetical protein